MSNIALKSGWITKDTDQRGRVEGILKESQTAAIRPISSPIKTLNSLFNQDRDITGQSGQRKINWNAITVNNRTWYKTQLDINVMVMIWFSQGLGNFLRPKRELKPQSSQRFFRDACRVWVIRGNLSLICLTHLHYTFCFCNHYLGLYTYPILHLLS